MASKHRLTIARWSGAALAVSLVALSFSVRTTEAHKAVTSKYNYTKDVFPLLRDHCGQCHVAGGPAPMSLLTYKDAVSWAEAVRDELTAERMPPWPVGTSSPAVQGAHPLSAHDIDVIVTWASGGTPIGDLNATLPETKFTSQWKLGAPDLKVEMDTPHTVAPGTLDETSEFTLPTGLTEPKWIRAVDLLPSVPSLARDATISVENGPVLAVWQPGGDVVPAPAGAAFKLAAGAKLHLRIHYKKHFDVEQEAVSDRSTVGLYFADPPASGRELQSLVINSPELTSTLSGPARIVALRPTLDQAYARVTVDAVSPTGTRVPLLELTGARPQWSRRYWLQTPVEVASGSKLEVSVTPLPLTIDEPKTPQKAPLQVALDYVPE